MAMRNTGTVVTDIDGNNATLSHLSTNIIIKVNANRIGAVQELSINESRDIRMIDEVGTDGHIDSAPSKSTDVSGKCRRVRFAGQRILEAFSRPYVHVKSQRIPFDMEIQDLFANADAANAVITVIKNVWISGASYSYSANDFVIVEDMDWKAEDIYSFINNNNVVQAVANGRANPIILNQYEREADRGLFRGALDAAGVLNAFLDDPRQ